MPASSSTSWNRSRSPVTTSTSAGPDAAARVASVPATSSASRPGPPTRGMPNAARTSAMTGTCGSSAAGVSSVPSAGLATRCALYEGSAATRNAGRQSSSQHATSRRGCRCVTSVATMSRNPRTALIGLPSGAFTDSGTPKKARKYRDAESSSMRRSMRDDPASDSELYPAPVEDIDRAILRLLLADGRMSYTDLGKATGLSTSAVHQRVRRLEQRGGIPGDAAGVDPEAVGLPMTAFISVKPFDPSAPDDIAERLADVPEIEACHSVAGDENYILKVRVATPHELEELLARVRSLAGVSTRTTVVLSTPYEARPPRI